MIFTPRQGAHPALRGLQQRVDIGAKIGAIATMRQQLELFTRKSPTRGKPLQLGLPLGAGAGRLLLAPVVTYRDTP
jgi:hypothetical protein